MAIPRALGDKDWVADLHVGHSPAPGAWVWVAGVEREGGVKGYLCPPPLDCSGGHDPLNSLADDGRPALEGYPLIALVPVHHCPVECCNRQQQAEAESLSLCVFRQEKKKKKEKPKTKKQKHKNGPSVPCFFDRALHSNCLAYSWGGSNSTTVALHPPRSTHSLLAGFGM